MRTHARAGAVAGTVLILGVVPPVLGGDGFDWVTIGDAGNIAYSGPDAFGLAGGRGSVGYEYRISRLEVTTAQWLPFVNLFWDDLPSINPTHWGADLRPDRTWALRTDVPNPGMLPVDGLSWEEAAMYVNWLHNGKRSDLASTQSGVYDVSTFTLNPDTTFNHQIEPAPGARYWIPSLDEWLKAAHYDPNKNGPGQGGWWRFVNSSDTAPVPGLPGEGDTSAFLDLPGAAQWDIPLGAYPHVQSPWGLLDLSGGAEELTSEDFFGVRRFVVTNGTWAGFPFVSENADDIQFFGVQELGNTTVGLRLASRAIPAPTALTTMLLLSVYSSHKRSRRNERKHMDGTP